jgi:hypothetical protein
MSAMGRLKSNAVRIARASFYIASTLAAVSAMSCGDDVTPVPYENSACRFNPGVCGGGPGASCRTSADCFGGFCCSDSNCGGGMCTFACNGDIDCPPDMACQHNTCFFRCRSRADCAPGQNCEHGSTVCEWP